jgi:hypothetical protein
VRDACVEFDDSLFVRQPAVADGVVFGVLFLNVDAEMAASGVS